MESIHFGMLMYACDIIQVLGSANSLGSVKIEYCIFESSFEALFQVELQKIQVF